MWKVIGDNKVIGEKHQIKSDDNSTLDCAKRVAVGMITEIIYLCGPQNGKNTS